MSSALSSSAAASSPLPAATSGRFAGFSVANSTRRSRAQHLSLFSPHTGDVDPEARAISLSWATPRAISAIRTADARASDSFIGLASFGAACPSSATTGNSSGCIFSTSAIASSTGYEPGRISDRPSEKMIFSTISGVPVGDAADALARSGQPSSSM